MKVCNSFQVDAGEAAAMEVSSLNKESEVNGKHRQDDQDFTMLTDE